MGPCQHSSPSQSLRTSSGPGPDRHRRSRCRPPAGRLATEPSRRRRRRRRRRPRGSVATRCRRPFPPPACKGLLSSPAIAPVRVAASAATAGAAVAAAEEDAGPRAAAAAAWAARQGRRRARRRRRSAIPRLLGPLGRRLGWSVHLRGLRWTQRRRGGSLPSLSGRMAPRSRRHLSQARSPRPSSPPACGVSGHVQRGEAEPARRGAAYTYEARCPAPSLGACQAIWRFGCWRCAVVARRSGLRGVGAAPWSNGRWRI